MTVSSSTNSASYSGNGSTTVFAYGFKIFDDSDLTVTLVNDTTGVETLQTLTTNYTVSGAGTNSGGNVTFVSAPASGVTVKIERVMPYTQTTAYTENDPFPAQAHEDALDKLTMLTQQAPTYDTGTFVPVVADAATSGNTATVATTSGRYTKIGNMVHLNVQLSGITTTGMTGSNQVFIRNLPYTAYDSGSPNAYWIGSMISTNVTNSSDGTWVAIVEDNTGYIKLVASVSDSAAIDTMTVSEINSGTGDIWISITYEAA
jgi:hypothetical protein